MCDRREAATEEKPQARARTTLLWEPGTQRGDCVLGWAALSTKLLEGAFQKGSPASPAGFNWVSGEIAYNVTRSLPLIPPAVFVSLANFDHNLNRNCEDNSAPTIFWKTRWFSKRKEALLMLVRDQAAG